MLILCTIDYFQISCDDKKLCQFNSAFKEDLTFLSKLSTNHSFERTYVRSDNDVG